MKYIVFNITQATRERAKDIARMFYKLSRPLEVRHPDDVTLYWWGFYKHPTLSQAAFEYDPFKIIPIDTKADAQEVIDLLYPNATDEKKAQIIQYIKENRQATVDRILPDTWTANAVDYEDLALTGWLL